MLLVLVQSCFVQALYLARPEIFCHYDDMYRAAKHPILWCVKRFVEYHNSNPRALDASLTGKGTYSQFRPTTTEIATDSCKSPGNICIHIHMHLRAYFSCLFAARGHASRLTLNLAAMGQFKN
jgi:hypothetical protein